MASETETGQDQVLEILQGNSVIYYQGRVVGVEIRSLGATGIGLCQHTSSVTQRLPLSKNKHATSPVAWSAGSVPTQAKLCKGCSPHH